MGQYFKVTKKFIMSEAIADVKGKAKDSLDELCSMVETLLVSTYSTSYSKISQNFWFKVIEFFVLEWKRRKKGGSYP